MVLALGFISCTEAQKTTFAPKSLSSEMTATDLSETTFQEVINSNKGKIIVIDVWASWCSDCIKGMPKLKELQEQNPDVVYLFLSMDKNAESWLNGIKKHELKGQHFWIKEGMSGVFGKSIALDWIPRYMVVDQEGKIALYKAIQADDTKMTQTIKNLQTTK